MNELCLALNVTKHDQQMEGIFLKLMITKFKKQKLYFQKYLPPVLCNNQDSSSANSFQHYHLYHQAAQMVPALLDEENCKVIQN